MLLTMLLIDSEMAEESRWMFQLLGVLTLISGYIYISNLCALLKEANINSTNLFITSLTPYIGPPYSYVRIKYVATINGWDIAPPAEIIASKPKEKLDRTNRSIGQYSVLDRMEKYHIALNLAVAEYLLNKLHSTPEFSHLSESNLLKAASPIANLMFGRTNPIPNDSFITLSRATELANLFINENPLLEEVVIQSRRVMATIRFGRTGEADTMDDYAHMILEKHGHIYPISADPDTYPLLLDRFIDALPVSARSAALSLKQKVFTS